MNKYILITLIAAFNLSFSMNFYEHDLYDLGNHRDDYQDGEYYYGDKSSSEDESDNEEEYYKPSQELDSQKTRQTDIEVAEFVASTPRTPITPSEAPTPLKEFFKEVIAQDQTGKQYTVMLYTNSTFEDLIEVLSETLNSDASNIGIYTKQELNEDVPKFVKIHNPNITPKYKKTT